MDKRFIWMYRKGRPYKPGRADTTLHNPIRVSLKRASVVVDYYAYERPDGTIDSDTYENALERLEKPAIPIIRAIEKGEPPSAAEREDLANFIYSLHKRVPARFDRKSVGWADFLSNEKTFQALTSEEFASRLPERQRTALTRLRQQYEKGPPKELLLKTMVSESQMVKLALTSMTWRFLRATESQFFVTSDDPVFISGLGLTKAGSELTLPLTQRTTLHASWQSGEEGFLRAPESYVGQLNRRTVTNADHVFAPKDREWCAKILNRGNYPIFLLDVSGMGELLWKHRETQVLHFEKDH